MKKMLVIFAVMAFAGSAMAADDTVDVNVTIAEYIAVEGQTHSETITPVYDAAGNAWIGTAAYFLVNANVNWSGTAVVDNNWWMYNGTDYHDGPSEVRTGAPGMGNSQGFSIGKTIHITDGLSFPGTVTFTVNSI